MKKFVTVLLCGALIVPATELSREFLIQHAFDSSESLIQIHKDQKSAVSIRKEYYGKGLPTITGVVQYEHKLKSYTPYDFGLGGSGGESISSMMDQTIGDPYKNDEILSGALDKILGGLSSIDLTPKKNSFATGIKITQPIFAQGKVVTGLKIADVYAGSLEEKYSAERFKLAKEITICWYGAVLAEENLKIREESVKLAAESHRLTQARFIAGQGKQVDTLNTRYALQQAKSEVRSAQKDQRLAIEKLLMISSVKCTADSVNISDSLVAPNWIMTEDEARSILLKKNKIVTQLDRAVALQKLQTTLAKSDFLPTIYAGADFMAVSQYNNSEDIKLGGDHKLFAGMSVPIFSGGQRVQKINQASYAEEKLEAQKSDAIDQLNLALSASYEEFSAATERYNEAQELVTLTTKARSISAKAFEVGQVTQLDLTTSDQNARLAKLSQNAAVFDIINAVTSIRELIGDETLLK